MITNEQTIQTADILEKAATGARISEGEAMMLWRFADFYDLGKTAQRLRASRSDIERVSYTVFQIVNYTNICSINCTFCSFHHKHGSGGGYTLTKDEILEKAAAAREKDCRQIFLQGGVNPEIKYDYYLEVLGALKAADPEVHIRGFSPVEILSIAKQTQKSSLEVLRELKVAGLDSFPGAGAEILTERVRHELSRKKATPIEWYETMKAAFSTGMSGSANIVWGSIETSHEIIAHLSMVRRLQDETGGLLSFVPWTFQKQTKRFYVRKVPAGEYLRMVALCRIFLDNIANIEVSLLAKGPDIGELALLYGANDISSPVLEENVLTSQGLHTIEQCVDFIKQAGFEPVRRNFLYEFDKKS